VALVSAGNFTRVLFIDFVVVSVPLVAALVLVCKRNFKLATWFVAASLLFYLLFTVVPIIGLMLAFSDFRIRN